MKRIPWRRWWKNSNRGGTLVPVRRRDMLRGEIDRMFDRFFEAPWSAFEFPWGDSWSWTPTVDVSEDGDAFEIRAEVPGVDPKDLQVSVEDGLLVIAGEKTDEAERSRGIHHVLERRFGSFRRTIELPSGVDPGAVEARHANGVLTVRLRRREGHTPRRIPVDVRRA